MGWLAVTAHMFLWLLLGRLVGMHAQAGGTPRGWLLNPGVCLVAGATVWILWWLVLVPLLGAGTWVAWGSFAALVLGLSGAMYRTWHRHKGQEHFWNQLLTSALLIFPLAGSIAVLWPQDGSWWFLQLANQLGTLGGWPTAVQQGSHHFVGLATASGWLALNVAAGQGGLMPWMASGALNLVGVVALALVMREALEIPLRWSNLLLVLAGSIGLVVVAFPVPLSALLASASPVAWAMLGAVAATVPLLSGQTLPVGLGVLPCALALSLLVLVYPAGAPLALVIGMLWLVRQMLERRLHKKQPSISLLTGWTLLATLPLMAVCLHVLYGGRAGQAFSLQGVDGLWTVWHSLFGNLPPVPTGPLAWQLAQLGLATLVVMQAALAVARGAMDGKGNFCKKCLTVQAWQVVPAVLLVCLFAFGVFANAMPMVLPLMWPFIILPLWRQALGWYHGSTWQRMAWRGPWRVGLTLSLAFYIWQQVHPQPLPPPLAMPVLAALVEARQAEKIKLGLPLGVLSPMQAYPWASYVLGHHAPAVPMDEKWTSLGTLHRTLRGAGVSSLVVVLPTPAQQQLLQLPPETLLATFTTEPDGLTLTGLYTNPLYTENPPPATLSP